MARQKHSDANSLCCSEVDYSSPICQFIHWGLVAFFPFQAENKKGERKKTHLSIWYWLGKINRTLQNLRDLLKMTLIVSE